MFRRTIGILLRPVAWLLLRMVPVRDPWVRVDVRPALNLLGSGARYEFEWYFQGPSTVPVSDLHELRSWLRGCRYVGDPDLFHESDYWQHPRTFEQLRRGDCEDFALWAWRKLVELGYDADLVIGSFAGRHEARHAWIVFRDHGGAYLMEPGNAGDASWVRPLHEARAEYVPMFGVGPDLRRFTYAGYLLVMRQPRQKAPAPEGGPGTRRIVRGRGTGRGTGALRHPREQEWSDDRDQVARGDAGGAAAGGGPGGGGRAVGVRRGVR